MIMEFGADVELVKSGGGVFEVTVDDRLVFSKKSLGRFPEQGELKGLAAGGPPPLKEASPAPESCPHPCCN